MACWLKIIGAAVESIKLGRLRNHYDSCCCLEVKSCPTLCDPMNHSMPGPPFFHCLPEFGHYDSTFKQLPLVRDFEDKYVCVCCGLDAIIFPNLKQAVAHTDATIPEFLSVNEGLH